MLPENDEKFIVHFRQAAVASLGSAFGPVIEPPTGLQYLCKVWVFALHIFLLSLDKMCDADHNLNPSPEYLSGLHAYCPFYPVDCWRRELILI
jgi:hypothetical protein